MDRPVTDGDSSAHYLDFEHREKPDFRESERRAAAIRFKRFFNFGKGERRGIAKDETVVSRRHEHHRIHRVLYGLDDVCRHRHPDQERPEPQ